MKNFKLKSMGLGLMAALMLTIFISSCGQEEVISTAEGTETLQVEQIPVSEMNHEEATHLRVPKGFENKSDVEQELFWNELSDEQFSQLEENYRVADYLSTVELLDTADEMIKDGELLADMDLSQVLSANQLRNLKDHEASAPSDRYCYWALDGSCWTRCNDNYRSRRYKCICNGQFTGSYAYFCTCYDPRDSGNGK